MTVPANLNRVDYTGTGSAGPFTVPFPFYDASHLTVLQTDALFNQTTLTGWTATGAGGPSGAVTLAAACPVGSTLTILRIVPLTQITSIKNQEAFYPEVHEQEMDLLAMADQQLDEAMDRTLRLPAGLSGVDMTLPRPDPGHALVWNAAGDGLENAGAASATLQQDLADSTDVAKGDEMIAVKQPFAGAVARTQHDKNAEWVSVLDFGADPTGNTYSDEAIALAIASSQHVIFPSGQYKISEPIKWTNQRLVGNVDNGELSTSTNQTMIICDGDFSAFLYHHPSGYNSQGGCIENFNIYFYGARPASPNSSIGIQVASTGGYPAFHTFRNITVRGATWAIHDNSGSWMGQWINIDSQHNYAGFYKQGGTTHTLVNCYHRDGYCGFYFASILGVTLTCCAVDLASSAVGGYLPIYISNSNVVINGGDFEGNVLAGDYKSLITVTGPDSVVSFNGCRFLDSQISNTTTEMYLIKVDYGALVDLNGVDFNPSSYTGTGGVVFFVLANNSAKVSMNNCKIATLSSGAPSTVYAGYTGSGALNYNNIDTNYGFGGYSRQIIKALTNTQNYTFGTINSGTVASVAFTVPGANIGDFVAVSSSASVTDGIFFTAQVTSSNTVHVIAYNFTGAQQTLPTLGFKMHILSEK